MQHELCPNDFRFCDCAPCMAREEAYWQNALTVAGRAVDDSADAFAILAAEHATACACCGQRLSGDIDYTPEGAPLCSASCPDRAAARSARTVTSGAWR